MKITTRIQAIIDRANYAYYRSCYFKVMEDDPETADNIRDYARTSWHQCSGERLGYIAVLGILGINLNEAGLISYEEALNDARKDYEARKYAERKYR